MRISILWTCLITFFLLATNAVDTNAQEQLTGTTSGLFTPKTSCIVSSCMNCETDVARGMSFGQLCDSVACQPSRWIGVETLLLFSDGFRVPPLVTRSLSGTPRPRVGVLGDPATQVLLGNQRINDDVQTGLRLQFGQWLDPHRNAAVTGSMYFFGNDTMDAFPSAATDLIARPFFNADPNVNGFDSELVNMAGVVSGSVSVGADTDVFFANLGLQRKLCCCSSGCFSRRMDVFAGYRRFSLEDELTISETLSSSAGNGFLPVGTRFDVLDRFETENQFDGFELGLLTSWRQNRWTLTGQSRIALGNTSQRVGIDGSTTITVPGNPAVVQPYGILAATSNIGSQQRNRFGVFSETQLDLGYQVTSRLRFQLGYNFVFLNSVARAGDHVDLTVNGTQIDPNVAVTGPQRPRFRFVDESVLLHGLSFGLHYRF